LDVSPNSLRDATAALMMIRSPIDRVFEIFLKSS